MARTIPQIEADIDNKNKLQILEMVKDYLVTKLNVEFGNINLSLKNLKNHVLGISQVTSQLGRPLSPNVAAPTDPADLVEGNWYFNITDKKFYMWHSGAWQELADLSHMIDTTPIQVETKGYSTWDEMYADRDALMTLTIFPKNEISVSGAGAAWRKDQPANLHNFIGPWGVIAGPANLSNGQEYKIQAQDASGFNVYHQGTKIHGPIAFNLFNIQGQIIKGKALVLGSNANVQYGTLEEVYKLENGETVDKSAEKVVNIQEIAELVKDQRAIDKQWLANFSDVLTLTDDTTIQYKDTQLNLVTLNAAVTRAGNTVSYTTLIKPYDRISQEQASFESTFKVDGMDVEYIFTGKGKAFKFSGNTGQKYKFENIAKFENNSRVPYIRFTGNATLQTADDALTPAPTWTTHTMPYEIKLTDLMDANNRTALVQMGFGSLVANGTELLTIDYLTSTYFIEQRFGTFLADMTKNNDLKYQLKTFDFSGAERTLSSLTQSGFTYVIIDKPAEAANTPIGATNQILLGTAPTGVSDTDQVTYGTDLVWIVKANGDIMNWSEIKDNVAAQKIMVIKLLSNGNWELVGWKNQSINKKQVEDALAAQKAEIDANAAEAAGNKAELLNKVDQSEFDNEKINVDNLLATKLELDLSNVKTTAEKTAFINGLKAIGIDTALFGEFRGVLGSEPLTPQDLQWYINNTDYSLNVYHDGTWHKLGAVASSGSVAAEKAKVLALIGLSEAEITQFKSLTTLLSGKVDQTVYDAFIAAYNTTLPTLATKAELAIERARITANKNKADANEHDITDEKTAGVARDVKIKNNEDEIAAIKTEQTNQNTKIKANEDEITAIKTEQTGQDTKIKANEDAIAAQALVDTTQNTNIAALQAAITALQGGATWLNDFPVLAADTDAQIITKLDTAFPAAKNGDYVEVIQPVADAADLKFFTMTKATGTWNKGVIRSVHLFTGSATGGVGLKFEQGQEMGGLNATKHGNKIKAAVVKGWAKVLKEGQTFAHHDTSIAETNGEVIRHNHQYLRDENVPGLRMKVRNASSNYHNEGLMIDTSYTGGSANKPYAQYSYKAYAMKDITQAEWDSL